MGSNPAWSWHLPLQAKLIRHMTLNGPRRSSTLQTDEEMDPPLGRNKLNIHLMSFKIP